jgi:hypothetical protein
MIVTNLVLSGAEAYVDGSTITTSALGNVTVLAENTSIIAVKTISSVESNGFGIGINLAFNTVGWEAQNALFNAVDALFGTAIGDEQPAAVKAWVKDTSIHAAGGVRVEALSDARITAPIDSAARSLSITPAGGSKAITVAAILAMNKLSTAVSAFIEGASTLEAVGGSLIINAADTSFIEAVVHSSALSVGAGVKGGTAVSISFAMARNEIRNDVEAAFQNAGSIALPVRVIGDVSLTASKSTAINADVKATAIAVAVGGKGGVAVSGGGAMAFNTILGKNNAFIADSVVDVTAGSQHHGDVTVSTTDSSTIEAVVGAAAVSVSVGVKSSPAIALGFSVARNLVGWDDVAASSMYTNNSKPSVLQTGDTVKIVDGPLTGNVYKYVGSTITDSAIINLGAENYGDRNSWEQAGLASSASQIQAYIKDSSVTAAGTMNLSATSSALIDAKVLALAVAVAASGQSGVSVSVAGVYTGNTIQTDVRAFIDGSGSGAMSIHAGSLSLYASDGSSIVTTAGAASVAASLAGEKGVAITIGLAIAVNEITNNVDASVDYCDFLTTTVGGITATAISRGTPLFSLDLQNAGLSVASLDNAAQHEGDSSDTESVDEAVVDATMDLLILGRLADALVARGEDIAALESVRVDWLYTTIDGEKKLDKGARIKLESGYLNGGIGGVIYEYLGAKETTVDLSKADYSNSAIWKVVKPELKLARLDTVAGENLFDYTTSDGNTSVRTGKQVKIVDGYDKGGKIGRVYVYQGEDTKTFDLGALDYEGESDWKLLDVPVVGTRWQVVTGDGTTYNLKLSPDGQSVEVSRINIRAIAAAASLGIGMGGSTGLAVSGAGAVAINSVLGETAAHLDHSTITSAGNITVSGVGSTMIDALVIAASAAVGAGGSNGIGASIGIAVARNFIGYDAAGGDGTGGVRASITESSLATAGSLDVSAVAAQTIDSLVFSGSVAIGAGGSTGLAASGSGVWSENRISMDIIASIDGDGSSGIRATALHVVAEDKSEISSFAAAVSIAAGLGGSTGASLSIGATFARNFVSNNVHAFVSHVDQGVVTTHYGIIITASEQSTINVIAAAASAAIGIGGSAGIALSGAGVDAKNIILSSTLAYADTGSLTSAADVTLSATDISQIDALVAAISIAAGVGGSAGVGASIGVSLARNIIGWTTDPNTSYSYTTDTTTSTIIKGNRVKILHGVRENEVYEYVGEKPIKELCNTSDENPVYLNSLDYANTDNWMRVDLTQSQAPVKAFTNNVSLAVAGDIALTAQAAQSIDAFVIAASAAIAAGGTVGVGLAGAGSSADNIIEVDIEAYMAGAGTIKAQAVTLTAKDTSSLDSFVGAAALSVGLGGTAGVAVSVGIGLAENSISTFTKAYIFRNSGLNDGQC